MSDMRLDDTIRVGIVTIRVSSDWGNKDIGVRNRGSRLVVWLPLCE